VWSELLKPAWDAHGRQVGRSVRRRDAESIACGVEHSQGEREVRRLVTPGERSPQTDTLSEAVQRQRRTVAVDLERGKRDFVRDYAHARSAGLPRRVREQTPNRRVLLADDRRASRLEDPGLLARDLLQR